ncbi:MAG: hypothetical protein ABIF71_14490 [Planctomycetota bacterium]
MSGVGSPQSAHTPTQVSIPAAATPDDQQALFDEREIGDAVASTRATARSAAAQVGTSPTIIQTPAGLAGPAPAVPATAYVTRTEPVPGAPAPSRWSANRLAGALAGALALALIVVLLYKRGDNSGPVAPVIPAPVVAGTEPVDPGPDQVVIPVATPALVTTPAPVATPAPRPTPAPAANMTKAELAAAQARQQELEVRLKEAQAQLATTLEQMNSNESRLNGRVDTLTGKLASATEYQARLEKDLAAANANVNALREQLAAKDKDMALRVTALGKQLEDTETRLGTSVASAGQFTEIISQLRETNDGLVIAYEKKLADFSTKVSRLESSYGTDRQSTAKQFGQYLVNWDRYVIVGAPTDGYVVGVKFTKVSDTMVRSDVFVLGVNGVSHPAFEIKVFDADSNPFNTSFKAALNRGIEKGMIQTANRKWETGKTAPRYFKVDFVQ